MVCEAPVENTSSEKKMKQLVIVIIAIHICICQSGDRTVTWRNTYWSNKFICELESLNKHKFTDTRFKGKTEEKLMFGATDSNQFFCKPGIYNYTNFAQKVGPEQQFCFWFFLGGEGPRSYTKLPVTTLYKLNNFKKKQHYSARYTESTLLI